MYTKPTDTHQYLSPDSCHPKHCTTSIPYSQALRCRRICSRKEDFKKRTEELRTHLLGRSYQTTTVDAQIQKASRLTCKTRNLVYLISCKRCGLQYVGETENALHIRMNGHRSDIRTKKTEKPVAAHFCQPDHSVKDLEVRGLKRSIIPARSGEEKESFWIFTLRTLAPDGMNLNE